MFDTYKFKFQNSNIVHCWLARIGIPRIMDDPYGFDEDKDKDGGSFQVSIRLNSESKLIGSK